MWQFLRPQQIASNMSEIDYIRLTEEREAYRKEIRDLKLEVASLKQMIADGDGPRRIIKDLENALSDAREECRVWRMEAMRNITR